MKFKYFFLNKNTHLTKLEGHMFETDRPHLCNTDLKIYILLWCRPTAGARLFCALVPHSSDKHRWDIHYHSFC